MKWITPPMGQATESAGFDLYYTPTAEMKAAEARAGRAYFAVWRWHLYGGFSEMDQNALDRAGKTGPDAGSLAMSIISLG